MLLPNRLGKRTGAPCGLLLRLLLLSTLQVRPLPPALDRPLLWALLQGGCSAGAGGVSEGGGDGGATLRLLRLCTQAVVMACASVSPPPRTLLAALSAATESGSAFLLRSPSSGWHVAGARCDPTETEGSSQSLIELMH